MQINLTAHSIHRYVQRSKDFPEIYTKMPFKTLFYKNTAIVKEAKMQLMERINKSIINNSIINNTNYMIYIWEEHGYNHSYIIKQDESLIYIFVKDSINHHTLITCYDITKIGAMSNYTSIPTKYKEIKNKKEIPSIYLPQEYNSKRMRFRR